MVSERDAIGSRAVGVSSLLEIRAGYVGYVGYVGYAVESTIEVNKRAALVVRMFSSGLTGAWIAPMRTRIDY